MSAARAASRSRHPSSIWRANQNLLRQRLASGLAAEGHPEPHLAATLLSIRGRLGLGREEFCRVTGADPALVAAVEDGTRKEMGVAGRTV